MQSGGPGPTSSPPAASSPVPRVEHWNSLKVGAVVSLTGRFSREGLILRAGYETWARAANDLGGINVPSERRRVQLVIADDESEPLQATRAVEKLVREDGVELVLGPYSMPMTIAVAAAAERLGALTVAPDASAPAIFARGLQMIVSVLPTDERYFEGLVALAERVGPSPRSMALIVPDEPFFAAAARGATQRGLAGGQVAVTAERFPAEATDLSSRLARAAAQRPTLLALAGEPEQLARFAPELRDLDPSIRLRAAVSGPPLRDQPSVPRTGPDGLLTVDWWSSGLTASGPVLGSARDFAERFQRDHGYPPDARAAAAAAAGLALHLGLERAGETEPVAVRKALATLDAPTFWGRLVWDAAGRNRGAIVPVSQLIGGAPRVVYPEAYAEVPLRMAAVSGPGLPDWFGPIMARDRRCQAAEKDGDRVHTCS